MPVPVGRGCRERTPRTLKSGSGRFGSPPPPGLGRLQNARELKTEARSERDPQMIVGSIVEIDFIPDIKPQSDRSKKRFGSCARVEHRVDVVRSQVGDLAGKSSET